MLASRYIHMLAKQRDLMGFDEVGRSPSSSTSPSCFIFRIFSVPTDSQVDGDSFSLDSRFTGDQDF